jgi:phenylacetate-coenzyme A ligase PaaK-like adenylate-forming protein
VEDRLRGTRFPIIKSDRDRGWQKYCGFFDLTTDQFMGIQETLLIEQLKRIGSSLIGTKLMGNRTPTSMTEFRHHVPLTSYRDYDPEFQQGNECLPESAFTWAHTSGASGTFKRVPYTREFHDHAMDNLMAAFILACSDRKGTSRLTEGDKVLFNVAPHPYLSGILADGASEAFNLRPVMPSDEHDSLDFKEKVRTGFETSLRTGVDVLVAMTSVLVKLGNEFAGLSTGKKGARRTAHPAVLYRYAQALLRSRLDGRGILPKDLWPLKAIIGWGIDTRIYRDTVREYWGMYPYELHACTEAGIMALQGWNRNDLTLIPNSNFFEFIPEQEWLRCRDDIFTQPRTVLLPDVQPGERYEVVITSFHGMPFIRYRLGHLIRITTLADDEAGVQIPQMVFETRADDLIDIAGFTRISEKTMAQAIANLSLSHEDWTIRKEADQYHVSLRLYIEMNGGHTPATIAETLQEELQRIDPGYRDLERMMDARPLEVLTLRPGTFAEYYAVQKAAGADLLDRKPPRMNAPDGVIRELEQISRTREAVSV